MIKINDFYKDHDLDTQKKIGNKTVGIIGAGGIGSNAAVALARSGVGKLIIADFDTIQITNLNRQYYFINQIGMKKVIALKKNLELINPFIRYEIYDTKIDESNLKIFSSVDILIEAVDFAETKAKILSSWQTQFPNKPIILSSGIAGVGKNDMIHCKKIDDFTFICGDEKTSVDDFPPYAPKVAVVANMMANLALELLIK